MHSVNTHQRESGKFVTDKQSAMYTADRKIHLMERMLKTTDEATLLQLETVLDKSEKVNKKKPSIYDFVGILTKKEANEMRKAIEETCEQINPDDWK